jgi:hypothetical protein
MTSMLSGKYSPHPSSGRSSDGSAGTPSRRSSETPFWPTRALSGFTAALGAAYLRFLKTFPEEIPAENGHPPALVARR